ncbi:MAG: hypothetical protein EZS28_008530 [Streblomastix strix]|uniref:Uncharacterized protein n=1 Tax=Streblomastix strix TaxID=222440 RepID=A0A5J4WLK2_9EUKA|nr:MAG: hypothetical protein EZS28_008530 [Streblomastix strix]
MTKFKIPAEEKETHSKKNDEYADETPPTRKDKGYIDGGNSGETLIKRALGRRLFSEKLFRKSLGLFDEYQEQIQKLRDDFLKEEDSEFLLKGILTALIIGQSTLRRAEIHRAKVTHIEVDSWRILSIIWEVYDTRVEITFKSVTNLKVCPTVWLSY